MSKNNCTNEHTLKAISVPSAVTKMEVQRKKLIRCDIQEVHLANHNRSDSASYHGLRQRIRPCVSSSERETSEIKGKRDSAGERESLTERESESERREREREREKEIEKESISIGTKK